MEVANILIRSLLQDKGDVYWPYSFSDGFTDTEKQMISEVLDQYLPKLVDSGFNNWYFFKFQHGGFSAKRATWDKLFFANTIEEMAEKVKQAYKGYKPIQKEE